MLWRACRLTIVYQAFQVVVVIHLRLLQGCHSCLQVKNMGDVVGNSSLLLQRKIPWRCSHTWPHKQRGSTQPVGSIHHELALRQLSSSHQVSHDETPWKLLQKHTDNKSCVIAHPLTIRFHALCGDTFNPETLSPVQGSRQQLRSLVHLPVSRDEQKNKPTYFASENKPCEMQAAGNGRCAATSFTFGS
jgi:hypothetical protein